MIILFVNDQIKKNLLAKEKIECDADFPQKMRDVRPSVLASLFNAYGGGCINDGIYISYPIMEFYGFSVEKFLCYTCQEEKKQNKTNNQRDDDYPYPKAMVYSNHQNEDIINEYQLK